MQNYDGCILWINFSKIAETVESVEHGQLWNQKGSLNPRTQLWLAIAARGEGLKFRANGVATSTSLVERRVS